MTPSGACRVPVIGNLIVPMIPSDRGEAAVVAYGTEGDSAAFPPLLLKIDKDAKSIFK